MNEKEKAAFLLGLQTAKDLLVATLTEFQEAEDCRGQDTGAEQSALLVLDQKLIDAIRKARLGQ